MNNESKLLEEVREILRPVCIRLIRINGGTIRGGRFAASYLLYGTESKGSLRDSERLPDLIGILPDGLWLAVEVEDERKSQRNQSRRSTKERQRRFLSVVKQAGGISATVTSVASAKALAAALEGGGQPLPDKPMGRLAHLDESRGKHE